MDEQTVRIDFAQQYDKCGARVHKCLRTTINNLIFHKHCIGCSKIFTDNNAKIKQKLMLK